MSENVNDERIDCSLKVFRMILNYLFKETYDSFIYNNGHFKKTFLWLLRSICEEELMADDRKLDYCRHKIYMIYTVYLFSNYIKTNKIEFLLKLKDKLFSKDLNAMPIPSEQLNELRKVYVRKLANVCFDDSGDDKLKGALKQFLYEESGCVDVGNLDKKYHNYTNEQFYNEICGVLKQDQYFKHDSVLIKIAKYFDKCEDIDNPERLNDISQAFLEYLDFRMFNGLDLPIDQHSSLNNTVNNQVTDDVYVDESNHEKSTPQINQNDTIESDQTMDLCDCELSERAENKINFKDVKPTTSKEQYMEEREYEIKHEKNGYRLRNRNRQYANRYREWSISSSNSDDDDGDQYISFKPKTNTSRCSNGTTGSSLSSKSLDFQSSYTLKKTKKMYFVKRKGKSKRPTVSKGIIKEFLKNKNANKTQNSLNSTYNLRTNGRIKSEPS